MKLEYKIETLCARLEGTKLALGENFEVFWADREALIKRQKEMHLATIDLVLRTLKECE